MRMLISDLTPEELAPSALDVTSFDVVLGPDELGAAGSCLGCFGCWVHTPGRCVRRDALGDLGEKIAQVTELIVVSHLTWGGHSELVKRALDRCLPYLHCDFEVHAAVGQRGQAVLSHFTVTTWFWGPSSASERECARVIAAANTNNQHARVGGIWFCDDASGAGVAANSPASGEKSVRPWPPRRPHHVGLVCLSPHGKASTSRLLLDDLAAATRAYERRAEMGEHTLELFEVTRPEEAAGADALVLAMPLYVDELPSNAIGELARIGATAHPGTRVYALLNCGFFEPEQMTSGARVLELWCQEHGLAWAGAVLVGGGGMVPSIWGSPRLGWIRRPVSEATDELVLALRSGSDAGVIPVRQRIPRWAYILAAQAGWRAQARKNGVGLGRHER